ncbi:BZ3501_MvSof-1269-A2-R1_Chr3-2g06254 [Microbotryum saponariae]|nr:BZ3501_MvSof-1269-A2-R1_Chr3-2g06254 [Microbotryum saponariae]
MKSAVKRHPTAVTTGEVIVPVRFGMIPSTHLGVFAEAIVNPQIPEEVGLIMPLIYSPLFQTSDERRSTPSPYGGIFRFARGSVALMFLASMIDHLSSQDQSSQDPPPWTTRWRTPPPPPPPIAPT